MIPTAVMIVALAFLASVIPATLRAQASACVAPAAAIRLDHAIVVVHNLDSASARFAPLGFRFKTGRLHADSILNRHIKFRDGTELELMTLAGRPTSRMARDYAALLAAGEGGVYAALWTDSMPLVQAAAARLGEPRLTTLGAWQFLSLPSVRDAQAVFFGAGGFPANDPDSVLHHPNGAAGLSAAWVESGRTFEQLLRALGSRRCGSVTLPFGAVGVRWGLARGALVLVPPRREGTRRLLGVEIQRRGRPGAPESFQPLPGFWIVFR